MGYTTDFHGDFFECSRTLLKRERDYLETFSNTRRMKRDVNKLMELYKGKHGYPHDAFISPELIYGVDGEYFAYNDGNMGQEHDESIIDYNCPPGQIEYDGTSDFNERWAENQKRKTEHLCQPGLWCQWTPNEEGTFLEWDGGEKFYDYIEWLEYLIEHFFDKWGVRLNGFCYWEGEDTQDRGKIVVKDNVVTVYHAKVIYGDEE